MDSLLFGAPEVNRIYGVVIGLVIDNKDPESLYRVKVKLPWVKESTSKYSDSPDKEDFPSAWARVTSFMAGPDRGAFFLPEVDDEVLVAFEHGDIKRPFVIGCLWSPVDKSIHDNKGQDGKNNYRSLVSRSGHVIQFMDDAENKKEKIIIQTKSGAGDAAKDPKSRGGHFIVLDASDGAEKIEIYDGKQENFVLIDSTNKKITLTSAHGDILISAPEGTVRIECKMLETETTSTSTMKSQSALKIQGQSTINIESAAGMTIKGATVKIN